MSEQNRKEDYFVNATILGKSANICDIPCKIFLPERIYEKPSFLFRPNERSDATLLMSQQFGGFKAIVVGPDQKARTTIEAKEVYFSKSGARYWGPDLSEPYAQGEPQHLMITDHLELPDLSDKTHIVFWITPNDLLTPSIFSSLSYTGDISRERHSNAEFTIQSEMKLVFDMHFKTKNTDTGDLVQWSYLVACAELTTPATDLESLQKYVLPHIDDFLLIASLAAGKRTACLGWTATDEHSHATYYRGNYAFPDCNAESGIHDYLADRQSSKEFIETCHTNFLAHENQLALRSAICAAVPLDQHTLEAGFLSKFAGLETLLLSFRKQNSLEDILPPDHWKSLKCYLQKCIRQATEPELDHKQKKSIYNKLDELNRVSIKEAFETFRQHYGIYLSDLWPTFGEKDAIGLVDIRNKLIHGDPFPNELVHALSMANIHLQFTLERSLVRVLGWDITKTKVNPAYLGHYFKNAMTDFSDERKQLTDYIRR